MLTRLKSSNRHLLKYLFIIPILLISLTYVACTNGITSKKIAALKEVLPLNNETKVQKPEYETDITSKKIATPKKASPLNKETKDQKPEYDITSKKITSLKKISPTNSETKAPKPEHKTDQTTQCLNLVPEFDYEMNNYIQLENKDENLDAVVALIYQGAGDLAVEKGAIIRIAYVRKEDKHYFKNIPKGKYTMKIARGNEWVETNNNGICTGKFKNNASYSVSNDILDFKPIKTPNGIEIPSYNIDLGVVKTKEIEGLF